ncbi:MBL fold metallo-hydrolase [Micromonospora deserti]|uniref:MBL fold metallo-hydrolase n=1 Tax=Micromonospora deserti TaxID=2070366 RepID=A0A2W2D5S8_9ACTN|nr:MBL fold metallo-hydrolase [Micromonospora deserti]PZF99058.1 MBL fold metallo-hydrolase [Micromonospora deserti]
MARSAAIPLAPGVWRIPTAGRSMVNSYALTDDDGSVTLVDCGLKRAPDRVVRGLAAIGKAPADVTRIVLTHAHADHAGGAAELARRTGAPVAAHAADVPYAESGRVPPRANTAGRFLTRLAGGRFPAVEVARPLTDGDVLAVGGGLRVVHTPGHSPGHVSLLHEPTRVLITGDALFNVAGIRWPVRAFCADFRMTQRTAHVLGELDYDIAAFTHGPELTTRAREQVRAFLSRLR